VLHIFCSTCVSFFKANNARTRCMWCTVHWDLHSAGATTGR
jgi:hypothetical protein